ncbi:MAG: hypothetical protein AB7O37_03165 [Vicinamibacteria bacterium]
MSLALGATLALVGLRLLATPARANAGPRGGLAALVLLAGATPLVEWALLAPAPGAAAGFALGAALVRGAWVVRGALSTPRLGALAALASVGALLWLRPGAPALDAFFASPDGLLFRAPALWLGVSGLALLAWRGAPLGRTLAAATAILLLSGACAPEGGLRNESFAVALPLLGIGLAASLTRIETLLVSRPWLALGVAGAALTLWNGLLIEQYRRYLIPRDDTVSFAEVTGHNAALLSAAVGTPLAWPANWLFAARHASEARKYDLVAGTRLFRGEDPEGLIDLGDPRTDPGLLGEGWARQRPCLTAICRGVEGYARVFLPLERAGALELRVAASGRGSLELSVNGRAVGGWPLAEAVLEARAAAPTSQLHAGVNEITLRVSPGGQALVDKLTLVRKGGAR